MRTERGGFEYPFTFASRFGQVEKVSPEDLVAAAHAGCFSMALSNDLSSRGHVPDHVQTAATVSLGPDPAGGFHISTIQLVVKADVPGLDEATFMEAVEGTRTGCPISKLYAGANISVDATLNS